MLGLPYSFLAFCTYLEH